MTDEARIVRRVWQVTQFHDKGRVCPAAMWDMVVQTVDGPDPDRILGLTSAECQAALRRIYHERPGSLQRDAQDETSRWVRAAIERWCLAPDAEPVAVPYHVGTEAG